MEKRVKLSIFLILFGTLSGLSIGFYKGFTTAYTGSFPYMQVKGIKRWIKPLSKRLTFNKNKRVESYNYVSNDFSYPHLGADKVSFNKNELISINYRSNDSQTPDVKYKNLNIFSAIDGKKIHSINTNNLKILSLDKRKCVLYGGTGCPGYYSISFEIPDNISGPLLISFKSKVNVKKTNPNTTLIIINTDKNCRIGVSYPDYTFLAYNDYGGHSLYTQPFPIPGEMSSSIVTIDRPIANGEIMHSYFPTNVFIEKIEKEIGCTSSLSNSIMDNTDEWQNLSLIVLTGHDEYWTKSLKEKIHNYINKGGNLAIFSGNTAFRILRIKDKKATRIGHWDYIEPIENTIGLAFRYGGLPLNKNQALYKLDHLSIDKKVLRNSSGMKVIESNHDIFKNTNLKNGDYFGVNKNLTWYEVDGAPLNKDTNKLDSNKKPKVAFMYGENTLLDMKFEGSDVTPLASAWLKFIGAGDPQYSATIVEKKLGKGTIINGGSAGWFKVIDSGDETSTRIFLNIIEYLLKK